MQAVELTGVDGSQMAAHAVPLPGFVPGTLIEAAGGPTPVEDLSEGDLVVTQDEGLQPLCWVGQSRVAGSRDAAPIRFAPGVLGCRHALVVPPQQSVLITGWKAELFFGEAEVLVEARHLTNGDTVCRVPAAVVRYHHLLLDAHHIIFADGMAVESLHPDDLHHVRSGALATRVSATMDEALLLKVA